MTSPLPLKLRGKTLIEIVQDLEERLASVEHWNNQQSMLLTTLGDVMEELKKQEH